MERRNLHFTCVRTKITYPIKYIDRGMLHAQLALHNTNLIVNVDSCLATVCACIYIARFTVYTWLVCVCVSTDAAGYFFLPLQHFVYLPCNADITCMCIKLSINVLRVYFSVLFLQ